MDVTVVTGTDPDWIRFQNSYVDLPEQDQSLGAHHPKVTASVLSARTWTSGGPR